MRHIASLCCLACLLKRPNGVSILPQARELEEAVHERDALAVRLGMLEAKLDETLVERGQVGSSLLGLLPSTGVRQLV